MTPRRVTLLLFLFLLPVGCGGSEADFSAPRTLPADQRPTQWDVPTQKRLYVEEMRAPGQANKPPAVRYTGTTPAGWETQPGQPARFRDLVWRVAGDDSTECYLTARTGGGIAMNLNRWYDQFQLPAAPVETLPEVELAGKQGRLLELSGSYNGKPGQGMMLAFTAEGESVTTLKFTGPEATVKAHRDAFLALCKSLRPDGQAPADAGPVDPNQPPLPATHGADPAAAAPFTATIPAGWVPKASTKPLHHTFPGEGEVYVSQISGEVRQMFDMWRGEVGLTQPMSDGEWQAIGKVPMLGGEGQLLDVRGDHQSMSGKKIAGARLLVAAKTEGGSITFAKLVGKAAEADAQFEAFRSFCTSLRRAP